MLFRSDPPTADNEEVEVGDVWTFPRTVNVKNPNANATRVSYDDNGSSGVKQNWEWGDKFVLYNSNGDSVTYSVSSIATDHSKAIFELDGYNDLEGSVFYAVYRNGRIKTTFSNGFPTYSLNTLGQSQSASGGLSGLKNFDLITTGAITDIEDDLTFTSEGSLLTFRITDLKSGFGAPTSLTISVNGASDHIFQSNYNASADIMSYDLAL